MNTDTQHYVLPKSIHAMSSYWFYTTDVSLVYLSVCLSTYPSSIYLSVCLSVCPSICLSIYLSIYPSIHPTNHPSACLSIHLSSIRLPTYQLTYLARNLPIHLLVSIYPPTYLPTYLPTSLSAHLPSQSCIYTFLSVPISIYLLPSDTHCSVCEMPWTRSRCSQYPACSCPVSIFHSTDELPDSHPVRQTCQIGETFTAGRILVSATSRYIMQRIKTHKTGSGVFWNLSHYPTTVNRLVFQRLKKNIWSKLL